MSTPVRVLVIKEVTRDHFDFEGRIVSLQGEDQKSVFGKKQLKPQSLLLLLMLKKKSPNLPALKYFLLINCHKCNAIKLRVSLVNFKVISTHCEAPPNLF